MRSSIDVVKQVAVTLYYLSDEGRIRKTANAFGISRTSNCFKNCKKGKTIKDIYTSTFF